MSDQGAGAGSGAGSAGSSADVETVERVIPAPPERIFELLADPARHPEIDGSGTVRGVKTPAQTLALGSKFGMAMKVGIPYSMVSTVIEFEPNRRIAWQTRPPGRIPGKLAGGRIWRYELEPVDGGTRVRESWDISQEVLKILVKPARGKTIKAMNDTLERIEKVIVSETA
jgi:uncharacterized protein YndB with AHSA1/START domain